MPGWWGIFINPYFIARYELLKEIRPIAAVVEGGILVDVGCGVKPYAPLFRVDRYFGIEMLVSGHSSEAKFNDIFFDGGNWPIKTNSIDTVMATQVFEHVFEPEKFLDEVSRILKPGGRLIMTVPFVWDEHEQPYDFGRYTSFGLTALLERNGFKVVALRKTAGYIRTLTQMACSYLMTTLGGRSGARRMAVHILLGVPIMIVGILASFILPGNKDFYLDNVVLAEKDR